MIWVLAIALGSTYEITRSLLLYWPLAFVVCWMLSYICHAGINLNRLHEGISRDVRANEMARAGRDLDLSLDEKLPAHF